MKKVIGLDDLKNFHEDAFQLIEPDAAGQVLFALVIIFIVLEPIFR